jgi:hypothetical protein
MALMRAARHAAIAVMALTASTHATAQDVGTFNPDAAGNNYSPDALEMPSSKSSVIDWPVANVAGHFL